MSTERYDAIYKIFNFDERQVKLAKNILRVDPYSNTGCLAILTYAFLVDSYSFNQVTAATVVNRAMPVIEAIFSEPSEEHICIVIVDKAFVVIPALEASETAVINLLDLSEMPIEEFAEKFQQPITNDAIDLNAVARRLILAPLAQTEPDQPAA